MSLMTMTKKTKSKSSLLAAILSCGILGCSFSILGCAGQNPRIATKRNDTASLTGDLPTNPLEWKVITSSVDKQNSTMSTLFGNDIAIQYARTNAKHDYPAGSILSLVTWTQQEDPRWFGGNIPSAPKSVEFVTVATSPDHKPTYTYESYSGVPLKKITTENNPDNLAPDSRAAYLLAQRAAVMP